MMGDTLSAVPKAGNWFQDSSAELHQFFGLDIEYFIKR